MRSRGGIREDRKENSQLLVFSPFLTHLSKVELSTEISVQCMELAFVFVFSFIHQYYWKYKHFYLEKVFEDGVSMKRLISL
jgi:hypothetical protein